MKMTCIDGKELTETQITKLEESFNLPTALATVRRHVLGLRGVQPKSSTRNVLTYRTSSFEFQLLPVTEFGDMNRSTILLHCDSRHEELMADLLREISRIVGRLNCCVLFETDPNHPREYSIVKEAGFVFVGNPDKKEKGRMMAAKSPQYSHNEIFLKKFSYSGITAPDMDEIPF